MSHPKLPPPRGLIWQLAWATAVGFVAGAVLTLALTDTGSAERLRHAFLVCPEPTEDRPCA